MARGRWEKRRITVEGEEYQWVLSPDDGCMFLLVSLLGRPGQRLRASFKYHDVWVPTGPGMSRSVGQRRAITPGVVLAVILAALGRGWPPSVTRPAEFCMHDADELIPPEGETDTA